MKRTNLFNAIASLTVLFIAVNFCRAQEMVVSPDKSNGVYQVGDTAHWTTEWNGDSSAPVANYVLKSGGFTKVGQGDLNFSNDIAKLESSFDKPNTILIEVKW